MALSNITLTSAMRANVLALQNNQSLFETTQNRLATGKKVNTALDDPIAYFAAKSYTDRAGDLSNLKSDMNEAIQTVQAANNGITSIQNLVDQAKSIANSALASTAAADRSSYAAQFDTVLSQITQVAQDASYKGTNLLQDGTLTVKFNEGGTNSLAITGFTASANGTGGLGIATSVSNWSNTSDVSTALSNLNSATTSLRTQSQNMSGNLAIVNTRLDFTTNMINTLQKGADNLTLADMNQEGANLLMLQTRQSLGTTALSLASQQAQSVLKLF